MATAPPLVAAGVLLLLLVAVCPFSHAFITQDDKDELLVAHNFYRGQVRPIATNMAKLVSQPPTPSYHFIANST